MQNYRYQIDKEDIILSSEENELVKSKMKEGKTLIWLRNESLAININFIRSVVETNRLTPDQEEKIRKAKEDSFKMFPDRELRSSAPTEFFKTTRESFYEKMGWGK
ncbi:MAG: hypothetical protein KGJ58_04685 [Patescibacteria group bacterium]|nr:hypothetical protein [Patescibacteria group bacterium]